MVNRKIKAFGEWLEGHLRHLCGEITPDKRIIVILGMFLLFAALSLYFTISSIYSFGKRDGQRMQIEHIKNPDLKLRQKQLQTDSVKHINDFYYEYERESEQGGE